MALPELEYVWVKEARPTRPGYWWVRCRMTGEHTDYFGSRGPVLAEVRGPWTLITQQKELHMSVLSWPCLGFFPMSYYNFKGGGSGPANPPKGPRAGWPDLPIWKGGSRRSKETR